ncbi:uncharacterized protein LOC111046804 [Nilaparvata lugens]|uniref:uncharacterized protein LOC111046804 n=1 Tax=Nilaparvata lugens TaxID=108931 RepID=UPI00193EBECC|nr:uncharacterized protein LOC111046804 [Nilaparvata lugens]
MKKTETLNACTWIVLFLASSCHGHFFLGSCPYLQPVDDFNLTSLEGTWYEIESTGSFIESSITRCNTPMFTLTGGKNFEFIYTRKLGESPILISTSGSGRQLKEGRLQLNIRLPVFSAQKIPYIFWTINQGIIFLHGLALNSLSSIFSKDGSCRAKEV